MILFSDALIKDVRASHHPPHIITLTSSLSHHLIITHTSSPSHHHPHIITLTIIITLTSSPHIITLTSTPSHHRPLIITLTSSPSHHHPHIIPLTSSPSQHHPHIIILASPDHHPDIITLTSSPWHHHSHIITLTSLPSHHHPHINTLTSSPSHHHIDAATALVARVRTKFWESNMDPPNTFNELIFHYSIPRLLDFGGNNCGRWLEFQFLYNVHHCGHEESTRTWEGTGGEFESWLDKKINRNTLYEYREGFTVKVVIKKNLIIPLHLFAHVSPKNSFV